MSERYSRLFSLPTNLYTEGSPILIAAGALLKDNHTNKVLVQLKFRNISQKAIKSVKVKVNAYDTAKGQLAGIDTFSYLDLSVAANEEFGQSTPIHLPDTTTRSFNVEILSVVYTDNEVFNPNTLSVAEEAPKDILEGVQRVEAEKQEMIKNKQCQRIMVCGIVSVASVLLSLILFSTRSRGVFQVLPHHYIRYIFALIVPCLCLLTAFVGKKNAAIIKPITIICVALFAIQIAGIVIYSSSWFAGAPVWVRNLVIYGINGCDFGVYLDLSIYGSLTSYLLVFKAPSFYAVLPNILCTTVLAIYSKKMK